PALVLRLRACARELGAELLPVRGERCGLERGELAHALSEPARAPGELLSRVPVARVSAECFRDEARELFALRIVSEQIGVRREHEAAAAPIRIEVPVVPSNVADLGQVGVPEL